MEASDATVKLIMNTSASYVPWPTPPAVPPTVVLARENLVPANPPSSAAGWQALVLDKSKIGKLGGVVLDNYYSLPNQQTWVQTYLQMYAQMATALADFAATPQYIIALISFGLDQNMLPTSAMQQVMRSCGAGADLEYWSKHCDPGSEISNNKVWVAQGFAYGLVGEGGSNPGTAIESYVSAPWEQSRPLTVTAEL